MLVQEVGSSPARGQSHFNKVFSFENNKILKSSNLELSLEYTQRHNFVTLCVYIVYFKSFAREKWTCQNRQKKP